MAGKVTVGTVYLKVQPDLDGFRRKVEQGTKGLNDLEIDVSPDMDGFRQKVNAATKGMRADVDVHANTKRLIAETQAAMKKISEDAQRRGHLQLLADFAHASADRRLKRFMDKANATSVVRIKVADLDRTQVSKVTDQIERHVSRDPVKVRFAVQRDQLNRAMENVRESLKKFGPGTKRYVQLSLGTSPKDSSSQRKMIAYLDQVRARIDKLKKPTSSPFEQWDGRKQLKDFTVDLGDLHKELSKLRKLDHDSWMIGQVGVSRKKESLPKHTRQLYELGQAHRDLVKRARESGKAYPEGFEKFTKSLQNLQREMGDTEKQYTTFTKQTRDLSKAIGNLVQKRTRKEIYTEKFLDLRAVEEARRGLAQVRRAYDATADRVQQANERIRESSGRVADSVRQSQEKLKNALPLRINLSNAIDPEGKVSGSQTGRFADRLIALRQQLDLYKDSADSVAKGTRRIATENQKAASSFSKLSKKTKTMGFGGRRRRGLKSIDEVGTERFAGLSRIGWIISAIAAIAAPAAQLISGLVASLPALGGAALAALGVTLLGLDGIKAAAEAAAPALERAKEAVSGVFETRMTPQFEQLGGLLDRITPQLTQVAHGMSDFSQGLVDGLTSNIGETNIQKLLGNTADLFSKMKPFAQDFTEGLLEMAGAGSETFPSLAEGMNRFGSSFKESISELSQSGQLQAAIQATYDTIGSLGTNLGRVLRAGIETAPDLADSLIPVIDGLGDGLVGLMEPLSSFSSLVGPVLGELLSGIGDIGTNIAPGLEELVTNITPGLVDMADALGEFAGLALGGIFDFLGEISPGAAGLIKGISGSIRELTEVAEESGPALDTFSGALAGVFNTLGTTIGESMPRMISDIKDNFTKFFDFMSFFDPVSQAKLDEQLSMYGNVFERFRMVGTDFNNAVSLAVKDIRTADDIGAAISENVASIKAAAERAMQATDIDLTPQIKKLDTAKTQADLEAIQQEMVHIIENGIDQNAKVEPEITVDPKVDLQGAIDKLNSSMVGPFADLQTQIEQFKVNAQAIAGEVGIDITPQIRILETATSTEQFTTAAQTIIDQIKAGVDTTPTEIDPNLTVSQAAPVDTTGVTDNVKSQVETDINNALSAVDVDMSTAAASIGSQLGDALGGVDVPMDGLVNSVTSQIDSLASEVAGRMSEITSTIQSEGDSAASAYTAAMEGMSSTSIGIVSGMASSIKGALTMDLTANGAAVGNTFAAGLESTVGRVRAAAAALAAAVSNNMPHSPAKEGPLSGKGWVDTSGIAVGMEFAAGIRSTVGEVSDATAQVAGAVSDQLNDFQIAPQANMEAFHRDAVLQPVLEANAKKIADFRKREAERAEKHNERMAKIDENKSKADKKEEQRVKAREDLAKQSAEAYEKLLESLEEPDYGKIDRSIQGYWIDGYKDVFKDALKSSLSAADFTGTLQRAVKSATSQVRKYLGDHPVLAQVEANVDAEAFHWAVYNAIEESGIHEVPINLAVANVDQLKRDLGMGDGVLSRALDQAISFDPGRSDARRYEEQKEEVHYHVTDMEEAIRLHQQMQRKELMKIPR